jgi:hypothetical protein
MGIVKTRTILPGLRSGRQITKNFLGAVIADVDTTCRHAGLEKTLSSGHPISLLKRYNQWFQGDLGGSFTNQKVYLDEFSPVMSGSWSNGPWSFQRNGLVPIHWTSFNAKDSDFGSLVSGNDLTYYGTKAWSDADPIRPKGQLSVALFELHSDGIPFAHLLQTLHETASFYKTVFEQNKLKRLNRHRFNTYLLNLLRRIRAGHDATPAQLEWYQDLERRHRKAISEGYLTWEFEWLPFVSDVNDFLRNVRNVQMNIQRVFLDGNMSSRRKRDVLSDKVSSIIQQPTAHYGALPMVTQAYNTAGTLVGTQTVERHFWFSGKFSWYVPTLRAETLNTFSTYETALRRGFGLEITPRSLYQAVRWSWLLDWVSDTGSILSNFTDLARDGLAANYAYIMAESKTTITYSLSGLTFSNGTTVSGHQSLITHNKQRIAASPFGFAVSPSSFTERQWNILSALGISRGYHAL